MPSLYSHTLPRQMPPTPPEYYEFLSGSARGDSQVPTLRLTASNARTPDHEHGRSEPHNRVEYHSQYNQARSAWPSYQETSYRVPLSHQVSSQEFSNTYSHEGVTVLPPIRILNRISDDHQHNARSKRAPLVTEAKEEKAMGGVAAHLDYKMEDMVDFVSETAQGMYDIYVSGICLADIDISRSVFNSKARVHPDFHKYVSQVLSSTRLPSSTILLGIHYLALRMTLLSNEGNNTYGNGQVHRMLTIALLLGSKFLDDNTFQNRSWSEVSGISVCDLNALEVEWLAAIKWNMHIDPKDANGFLRWLQQWQSFQMAVKTKRIQIDTQVEPLIQSLQQTHLDDVTRHRQHSLHQHSLPVNQPSASYTDRSINACPRPSAQLQWSTAQFGSGTPLHNHMDYSPPSAPETGPNTPDWFAPQYRLGYGRECQQNYPAFTTPLPLPVVGSKALQSDFHILCTQQFNPHAYGNSCACSYCSLQPDPFLLASGYRMQPVVG